ncbi:AAA family ATPase [Thermodesulfobacteriota bacterium]
MNQASTLQKMMDRADSKAKAKRPEPSGKQPRVICVSSGKGGVGKTNIVTNLAFALAKQGKKVLLLDADLNLANVDVLLGLTPRYNLHHVLLGEKSLTEILVDGPGGFKLLPAPGSWNLPASPKARSSTSWVRWKRWATISTSCSSTPGPASTTTWSISISPLRKGSSS